MSADIQIHVEGFINFRGIMRDREIPQGVQVGYFNQLGTTLKPNQVRGVLTFARGIGSAEVAESMAKLLCKYISKDRSKSRIVVGGQLVEVDPEQIKSIIEKQLIREH